MTMRLNGVSTPVSGITYVGTLPVYRRRGHLRKIMTRHFNDLYEKGEKSIAALYASRAAIYQRYGYGIVTTVSTYNVEPRYIQFNSPHKINGRLREAGEKDFPLLVGMYRQFREDKNGYLHRGKMMWDLGIFGNLPQGGSLNKIIYEEDGKPLGYVVYTMFQSPGGGMTGSRLMIRDLSWLSYSAYRAFWEHFMNMDLIHEITWRAPANDPLPHLLLEPRMLKATASDGLLARLVDVSKALTQRGYQQEGSLTFELVDDMCPWNSGKWKLEASTTGSHVVKTRQAPQIKLGPSTLAMLLFNQISATEAMRMARLEVNDTKALSEWDRVMRTMTKPACVDSF